MSLVVLDTDVLTLYQLGDAVVVRRVQAHPQSQLGVSIISIEEELTGWYTRLRRAQSGTSWPEFTNVSRIPFGF